MWLRAQQSCSSALISLQKVVSTNLALLLKQGVNERDKRLMQSLVFPTAFIRTGRALYVQTQQCQVVLSKQEQSRKSPCQSPGLGCEHKPLSTCSSPRAAKGFPGAQPAARLPLGPAGSVSGAGLGTRAAERPCCRWAREVARCGGCVKC